MRKVERMTMDASAGRDAGKTFVLTEMSADRGERWALRALLALTSSGVKIPDGATDAGMAGIASAGIEALGKIPFEMAEPLLAEMFGCVAYEHKPGAPLQPIYEGDQSQIEEIATRVKLRIALFRMHVGFSVAAVAPTTA